MATPVQNVIYEGTSELIKQALAQMAPELLPPSVPTRETAVEQMIANNQARPDDRAFLLNLSSDHFAKLHQAVQQRVTPKPPVQVVNAQPTYAAPAPQLQGPLTAEQYVMNAPPEIREVLADGLAERNAMKTRLVKTIMNNAANPFTEAYLLTKPMNELKGLAALSAGGVRTQPTNNYAGQGDVPMFLTNAGQVDNAADDSTEILTMSSVWDEPRGKAQAN